MPGRSPSLALGAFTDPLQQSLSCVTDDVLQYPKRSNKDYPNEKPHLITINNASRTPLVRDDDILYLSFRMEYRIVRMEIDGGNKLWKASTAAYYYSIDDADKCEIIAYHWHPRTTPAITHPHVHIANGCVAQGGEGKLRPELSRAHLPTGRIALEDMILSLIRDFGVCPLRDDWENILTTHRERFRLARTWS